MSAATKDQRRRDLATIHCLAKELALEDDDYRNILWTVTRVRSASKLDSHGRQKVIDHLRSLQQRTPLGGRGRSYPGRHSRVDQSPQLQKIEAILTDLHLPWSYADAIAKRIAGVPKVAWVRSPDKLRAIIAALGYEQQKRGKLAAIDDLLRELDLTRSELKERCRLKDGWERHPVALATAEKYLLEIRELRKGDA